MSFLSPSLVDVLKELMRFTYFRRDHREFQVDRYIERNIRPPAIDLKRV